MGRLRWQLVIVVVAIVAIAVLLLSQQPILRAFVPSPEQGGLYIEGVVGTVNRLNPLLAFNQPVDQDINRLIFSSLVRFDAYGNPQPDLAEEWGVSVDGTTYNFVLREGLVWHDGEPLTSADVVFTTNLLRLDEAPIPADIRSVWQAVDVVAFDERHIQFRLVQPFAPFMDYLAFGILPEHILGETPVDQIVNAPFNLSPVGSGPYAFDELLIEEDGVGGVVLNAFENYYLGRPFIDQIVFRFYDSAQEALFAYQQGEILGISNVTGDILPQVLDDPTLNLYSARMPKLSIVLLNLDDSELPFFQELEVRQALMHGINRQWLIDAYLNGQGFVAEGPILPGTWAYNENLVAIPFDTERAIAILKAAGYIIPGEGGSVRSKDGVSLRFDLMHPDDELHTRMAESIQADWAKIGVQVTLVAVPYETLVNINLAERDYQAALVDINLSNSPDPDPYPFWHQAGITGGQNYSKWDDRRASEYLEQARVSTVQATRARLYRNFQTHFNRELPALPLFFPVYNYAVSAQVQGVSLGPLFGSSDRFAFVNEWFLVARSGEAEGEEE
jgi:peptide/nickel transport system substrate-binding protein